MTTNVFQKSPLNWQPFLYFGNLNHVDLEKGVVEPLFPDSRFQEKCHTNCLLMDNPSACENYCQQITQIRNNSLNFVLEKCPHGGKTCCKKAAQHNDMAYNYCLHKTKDSEMELSESPSEQEQQQQQQLQQENNKKGNPILIIIVLLSLVILTLVIFLFFIQ